MSPWWSVFFYVNSHFSHNLPGFFQIPFRPSRSEQHCTLMTQRMYSYRISTFFHPFHNIRMSLCSFRYHEKGCRTCSLSRRSSNLFVYTVSGPSSNVRYKTFSSFFAIFLSLIIQWYFIRYVGMILYPSAPAPIPPLHLWFLHYAVILSSMISTALSRETSIISFRACLTFSDPSVSEVFCHSEVFPVPEYNPRSSPYHFCKSFFCRIPCIVHFLLQKWMNHK